MRQKNKWLGGFFVYTLGLLLPAVCGASAGDLIISQMQVAGDNGADDEFIEIYNPTEKTVSLGGWSVQYKSSTGDFPLSSGYKKDLPTACLAAGYYFLLGGKSYNGLAAADASYDFSLSGKSAGATVFLSSSTDLLDSADSLAVVDRLGYGTSASNTPAGEAVQFPLPSTTPAGDWAFARVSDTGNNFYDFTVQLSEPRHASTTVCEISDRSDTQASSTSWESLSDLIKISEIMPNPAGEDEGNEAVELLNNSTSTADLTGWFLSDNHGTSSVYQLPTSTVIEAGGFLVVTIPAGNFSLNNDGDAVNLYYPDLSLADNRIYATSAGEGKGWQNVAGQWMWAPATLGQPNAAPPPPAASSGGGASSMPNQNIPLAAAPVKINEILPDPTGDDAGNEWVEIYNAGTATASLSGYFIADGDTDIWSSAAFLVPKGVEASPLGFTIVTLPKGSVSLKNTGKERVKLFSPQKQILDSVIYEEAPANRSWAKNKDGSWSWSVPTPGLANDSVPPPADLVISELLPDPSADEDEFVEIFNAGTSTEIDLKGFEIGIGSRKKALDETFLAPGAYYVMYEDDLPAKLRNSGQTVALSDGWGREISKVAYGKAAQGQAYAKTDSGFAWTEQPTPGEKNSIVLAASVEAMPVKAAATVRSKSASEVSYAKLYQETKTMNRELSQKLDDLQAHIALLEERTESESQSPPAAAAADFSATKKENADRNLGLYAAVIVLAASSLGLLIKQYLWKKPFK